MRTNGPLGFAGWEQYSCGGGFIFVPLCLRATRPHYVTVTWPDGEVESFDFTPDGTSTFFPGQVIPEYTARDNRTTSTLSPVGADQSAFYDDQTGIIRSGGFGEGPTYDPQRFTLTDRFGTIYLLDVEDGLVEATDRNGNSVTITADGVTSSQGPGITFARDEEGRITSATGPDGKAVTYTYDTAGDLSSAVDQKGASYGFVYDASHYLTEIDDPGTGPNQILTYSADGRLESITDAEGNTTQVSVDVNARTEIVTSPDGLLTTISQFDERGNALTVDEVYDGASHLTSFTYNDDDIVTSRIDPEGNEWAGGFDDDENLTSFTDAEGNSSSFVYDSFGLPTKVTDPANNETLFDYDGSGNVTKITDARGGEQSFTYDARGNQITRTDQVGRVWEWSYDALDRVEVSTDPRGNSTTYSYDDQGRMILMTAADGGATSYGYDEVGNLVSVVDPLGRETAYAYDGRDRMVSMTDAGNNTTVYDYDDNDRLVTRTDPTSRAWSYVYEFDRLVSEVAPDGGVTSYSYDGAGRVSSMTDPLGRVTSYAYDSANRRTTVNSPVGSGDVATTTTVFDGNGRPLTVTNAEAEVTQFGYDELGRLVSRRDGLNRETVFVFDPVGNQTSVTNPNGETTTSVFDLANQLTQSVDANSDSTSYTYDLAGNLATVTDPLSRVTTFGYDNVNRQVSVALPSGDSSARVFDLAGQVESSTTAAGVTTSFAYDPRGLIESVTDELGNTSTTVYDDAGRVVTTTDARGFDTTFGYDPVGRVESETDPLGGSVVFGYDLAGQRTSVTDPNGATRTFGFDDGGRMTTAVDALGRATTYGYDDVARQVSMLDPRGIQIDRTFDDAGQLIGEVSPNETRSYSYDSGGRRTGWTDSTGSTTQAFDPVGRLIEVAAPGGTVGYAYNAAGERVSMTQPEGTVVYTYDANGFEESVTDWRTDTISLTNDADGRITGITRSNGVSTVHGFDDAGRLTDIAHTGPAGLIDSFAYTLDENGNRTAVQSAAGTETYTLDELNRLTGVSYPDATTEMFGYDATSNRTSHTRIDGTTVSYTLGATGQIVSDSDGVAYTYDDAGNLTGSSTGDTYSWDEYGRMVAATVDGVSQIYGYDAADVRVDVDGVGQVWDRAGMPVLVSAGTDSFVHTAAGVTRSGDDWALTDAVGSVRNVTDTAGALVDTQSFTAFGETLTGSNTFGFAGEQADPTGMLHLRARQYQPGPGRFTSVDPVQPGAASTPGWGLYGYAGSNPTTWSDPTGEATLMERQFLQVAAVSVVVAASQVLAMYPPDFGPLIDAIAGCFDLNGCLGLTFNTDFGDSGSGVGSPDDEVPCDLNCFGNTSRPRPPRPGKDLPVDENGFVHPTDPATGASSFGDPSQAPLTGDYWVLPEGTKLPEGLGVIPDGSDVGGPHLPTHHTIHPTRPMPYDEFADKFNDLPWEYGGRK